MKLSEAIREGIKLDGEQVFGSLFAFRTTCQTGEFCGYEKEYDFLNVGEHVAHSEEVEDFYEGSQMVGCCALGAAMLAVDPGIKEGKGNEPELAVVFPGTEKFTIADCPAKVGCGSWSPSRYDLYDNYATLNPPKSSVLNTIPHLNDDHEWTREQIADWVEGQGF